MEFNKKTGQMLLSRRRAWPNAHWPAACLHATSPFYPLIILFSHVGSSPNYTDPSFSVLLLPPLSSP